MTIVRYETEHIYTLLSSSIRRPQARRRPGPFPPTFPPNRLGSGRNGWAVQGPRSTKLQMGQTLRGSANLAWDGRRAFLNRRSEVRVLSGPPTAQRGD